MSLPEHTPGLVRGEHGEWYAFFNNMVSGGPMWQARTVEGDNLITSSYEQGHIEAVVHEHNVFMDFYAAAEEALRYISDDEMRVSADTPFMVQLNAAMAKADGVAAVVYGKDFTL